VTLTRCAGVGGWQASFVGLACGLLVMCLSPQTHNRLCATGAGLLHSGMCRYGVQDGGALTVPSSPDPTHLHQL
jgi:hypothetical protein